MIVSHHCERKEKRGMLRRRGLWILVAALVVIGAGGGYYYYTNVYAANQTAEEEPLQTATVRRGSIVISASGAGSVIPASEVNLAFQSGGLLTELLVDVGDRVRAGDVLARIDDAQARKALIAAQLGVLQAEANLADQLDTAPEQRQLELAQINLQLAQYSLDELVNWTPDETTIAQAEADLEAAQADYRTAQSKSVADQTASARISLEQAQESLLAAQEAYDSAWDPARDWELYSKGSRLESERESATSNLERAQQNLELAQASYNLTLAGISDSARLSAHNKVLSAQEALEAAQTGPDEQEIESARAQVLQAQISLANAEDALAATSEELELALQQAQLTLAEAQQDLDNTVLVARMDGTVMSVAAQVGENAGSSALITLADIDQPSIEVYLDETDLNSVAVGLEIEAVFDAFPDDTFSGEVVHVDPALVTAGGVQMVRAVVQLDAASYAKPQTIPIGANATVDVIGGRAENVLIVPVEALNEYTTGKYAVFKMVDGEPVFTPVEVGLMDYSFAEITAGLEQGDVVTTGIVETGG
jgi:HlyD family secretion protein